MALRILIILVTFAFCLCSGCCVKSKQLVNEISSIEADDYFVDHEPIPINCPNALYDSLISFDGDFLFGGIAPKNPFACNTYKHPAYIEITVKPEDSIYIGCYDLITDSSERFRYIGKVFIKPVADTTVIQVKMDDIFAVVGTERFFFVLIINNNPILKYFTYLWP